MAKRIQPIDIHLDNWPLSPLSISSIKMEYSRVLESRNRQKRCLLGNPELADHLYRWFHDAQETINVQVSLYRNREQDFLRSSLCIELDADRKDSVDNWQRDIATVLGMTDPDVHWTTNAPPKKEWKHAILLEVNSTPFEDERPERLIDSLFAILERNRLPLLIQSSFSLEWKQPAPLKKEKMPDDMYYHFHSREHWKRNQRYRLAVNAMPKRNIRRRIIVFSERRLSSLLKQSIFRGLVGNINAVATWQPLNQRESTLANVGPMQAMSFKTPHTEQISTSELRSMLTANLSKGCPPYHQHHPSSDDIPF